MDALLRIGDKSEMWKWNRKSHEHASRSMCQLTAPSGKCITAFTVSKISCMTQTRSEYSSSIVMFSAEQDLSTLGGTSKR